MIFHEISDTLLIKKRLDTNDFLKSFKGLIEPALLNILMEESTETVDEVFIKKYFKKSLFNIQLENENIREFNKISSFIFNIGTDFYSNVKSPKLRKIYSTTGLSLDSCIKISNSINNDYNAYLNILNEEDYNSLINKIFFVLTELDEMQDEKVENIFINNKKEDLNLFIESWVNGSNIGDLIKLWTSFSDKKQKTLDFFADFWNKDSNSEISANLGSFYNEEIDKMHLFINQMLQFRYPWGATAFLNILEYHILERQTAFMLNGMIKHIPSFMKYGVNDIYACFSKDLGVETREGCLFISKKYRNEFKNSLGNFEEFREWFSDIKVKNIKNFNLSYYDKLNISNISNKLSFKQLSIKDIEGLECDLVLTSDFLESNKKLKKGTKLILERNFNNRYNIYDINVLHEKDIVGNIPKRYSKVIALEMDLNDKKYCADVTYFSKNYTTIIIHEG